MKLRDLIRAVRACKTAAEERAVISKECALIRTAIKEEDETFRHRNVAKLMYIHMLGYPTHFGQMECLKLISASGFPEKRIGYLALTLLLTEQTEVLTLVTNSLKLDLTNSNQYIQALSLIAIGNLATQDMARDLASDVEKLLRSTNSYLRKKASLAAIRLLKKEPDLIEHMSERIVALLKDRAHGVLLTGLQLMIEVLILLPDMKAEYVKLVPALVRLLRNFISMGFSPEHDVGGITDPFMQVKLLSLLRMLGKGSEEASEQMNDVLAQVATNTETSKNAGNAILYECVQTIMEVESDSGLRVLAVNILGRFLLNRDNNIRYVALNSLSRVVAEDISAVQRHRNTIVECLKDTDVSIRQRALELIYQLVNEQNVVALTTELLNYLVVVQTDQKAALVSKIVQIIEKYSPSIRWRVDTIITMLSLAGNQTEDAVPRTSIIFISQAVGLQGYATHRLFRALQEDTSQQALLHVAIWCIGEYGDHLIRPSSPPVETGDGSDPVTYSALTEDDVVNQLDRCTRIHNAENTTKAFVLNALVKLAVRFTSPTVRARLSAIMAPFKTSMSLELQQRATEYSLLLSTRWDGLRGELLSAMPVLDDAALRRRRAAFDQAEEAAWDASPVDGSSPRLSSAVSPVKSAAAPLAQAPASAPKPSPSNLLDLDDIFGGGGGAPAPPVVASPKPAPAADLLADIFSLGANVSTPLPPQPPAPAVAPAPVDIFAGGLLSLSAPTPVPAPQAPVFSGFAAAAPVANPTIKAFDKAGFQVVMELSKPTPTLPANTRIIVRFSNLTAAPMDSLVFQAAVPKYLKLEMLPPSSTTIPPNSSGAVSQEIRIINSAQGEKNIMLKLKLGYSQMGTVVEELVQVNSFPPQY